MEKLLRVNMSDLEVRSEELPDEYSLLGGRAMTSTIVAAEVPPTAHALSERNKLVFAPGILTGTTAPSSGRLSVGAKSPLTGTIKESNAGGISAQKLASLGIRALVVEGQPAEKGFYVLVVSAEGAKLEPAGALAGLGCYELNTRLWEKYGTGAGIMCIGPAGEAGMPNAGVSTNDRENHPGRYAGRGGLGAVMGSKGLKAIVLVCDKTFEAPVADKESFKEAQKLLSKAILEHPVTAQALPAFGTAVLINILNEAGGLPTNNFSSGRFDDAAKTGGEAMAELCKTRGGKGKMGHGCHPGCIIRCSNIIPDEKGEVACAPLEYESSWALGANCGIGVLDTIARLNYLCNDVGLDTIETGVTIGVLMEAGLLPFGDGDGAIALLDKEVRNATPLGRIVGAGAEVTGRVFGVVRVPTVKGQGMPAYDPRAVKGIGVTYATSTMGADHTAGYSVTSNILKVGGFVDPLKAEGQVDLARNLQIATAFVDASGLCLFTAFPLLDIDYALPAVADMYAARLGRPYTVADAIEAGKEVLRKERKFNEAAGFTKAHDRLPDFMKYEKLAPHDVVFDVTDEELDSVYNF
ncbi:MAG: aldehyde ferredoxin oxidoreductase C-terminal domain-containing protein [Eubacteriales bacterium]|jgi:aldehyde:ferredoxin oxidoreductase|nr:aldehyde ferredoxin oxidoreductase [Bacillota bacterium]MBV1727344.1 aldehyde ferredoxin oxidoreductase [Desulforudis sp.]MDQ7789459.1 aldehyde ferredoxin oxidoreductase C-terminal domain-containing protein [Clostridia bacterium]MDZ4041941.1 aldehyde ferredoxin oxidoreductase C-terminal domain-containing protein [Eubacteriales bacterium]MBU4533475.1 aldehyde ferredoxin oxidoreductase [Bacillota bacterium]